MSNPVEKQSPDDPVLRLGDLIAKAERGEVAVSAYLTPGEKLRMERAVRTAGAGERAWFFGGYPTAERTRLFLLPEFYLPMLSASRVCDCPEEELGNLIGEEIDAAVTAVRIVGSRFRNLSHRDYLGSLMGLGLERDAIGDIAVQDGTSAVVFTSAKIADFLCSDLEKVASDTVKVKPYRVDEGFTDGRKYQPIRATVASDRLDCVVAALTDLSREEAQNTIRAGLVELNFEVNQRTDAGVPAPATLSVRGFGRYEIRGYDGETRRGRLRLLADKLV